MKAILIYAFAGLSLSFGFSPAIASDEGQKPCSGLFGADKENCQSAFDLLTKDAGNIPKHTIFAQGKLSGWVFRYDGNGGKCFVSNELRLPSNENFAFHYTSIDYEVVDRFPTLRIDALGINVTALPGRVSTINVLAPGKGKLDAIAGEETFSSNKPDEAHRGHTVSVEVVSLDAYEAWINKNISKNCDV